ncbi:MAG: NAD(P)/FAD-dependent oxidoreductase [Fibrobacter sp.]|jgi:digeranylgeranylglycerophospholipid reductase|nr:NAD(P)/FAD-dependent oxidoreductase [Fibrobacter sp.]
MAEKFDIAVIGAGPAGSMAAWSAALTGRRVCLLERKENAGVPVRCGEGIGAKGLAVSVKVKPEWIKSTVTKSVMVSPSGIKVKIANVDESYILDRERMDGDLVKEAVSAGVKYFNTFPVLSICRRKNGYECSGPSRSVTASIVILADGVESRLARFGGWDTSLALSDVESCAFTRVFSPLIEQDTCVFYTGSSVAPGGYAWIFPRGAGEANVGLGIIGSRSEAGLAVKKLKEFIDREFPGMRFGEIHSGGVPVKKWVRPLAKDGIMLVGDAARQVNCISGAGIGYALFAGKLCGRIAGEAVKGDMIDYDHLREYEKIWKKTYGKQQNRSFALKEFVINHADDRFLDRVANALCKEKPEKMNYMRVFARAFAHNPILLFKAFKLFG